MILEDPVDMLVAPAQDVPVRDALVPVPVALVPVPAVEDSDRF